jgi:DNA-binding Lrp family transcriptional regulator
MKAFVLIDIRTGEIPEVVRHLKRIDEVREAHMTLGPYDAVLVIEAANLDDFGKILATKVQPVPGVLETLTCMTVEL